MASRPAKGQDGGVIQLGQYPPPSHAVAHLSDPHLLAGDLLYGSIDTEANLRTVLQRLSRLDQERERIGRPDP